MLVSISVFAKKDKNGPPSANQLISTAKPRRNHGVCTLWIHPLTSPYPVISTEAEPVCKGLCYDIMKLKVSWSIIYVPRNLGICAISRLRCAFSESWNCVPISRYICAILDLCNMFMQSRDCASAICECNGLTGWERMHMCKQSIPGHFLSSHTAREWGYIWVSPQGNHEDSLYAFLKLVSDGPCNIS